MGLIVRSKKNQRVYIGDMILEVCFDKGQFKLYFFGPKPLPYKISRETLDEYKKRLSLSYKGENNEIRHSNLLALSESATAW